MELPGIPPVRLFSLWFFFDEVQRAFDRYMTNSNLGKLAAGSFFFGRRQRKPKVL